MVHHRLEYATRYEPIPCIHCSLEFVCFRYQCMVTYSLSLCFVKIETKKKTHSAMDVRRVKYFAHIKAVWPRHFIQEIKFQNNRYLVHTLWSGNYDFQPLPLNDCLHSIHSSAASRQCIFYLAYNSGEGKRYCYHSELYVVRIDVVATHECIVYVESI